MPLQDLTPQLRTRLNRMERAVGWFITLATLLLVAGFGYYIYNTAEQRGWFALKAYYYTYAKTGTGISVGDHIKLMGFDAGEITSINLMDPGSEQHVFIELVVRNDKFGYLWTVGSRVKFKDSGFLGKRELDLTTGKAGYCIYLNNTVEQMTLDQIRTSPNLDKLQLGQEIYAGTNLVAAAKLPLAAHLQDIPGWGVTNIWTIDMSHTNKSLTAIWNEAEHHYERVTAKSKYLLPPDESPALADRLATMVAQIQTALPGVLQLTNQISEVLSNATKAISNLTIVAVDAHPVMTNLALITAHLTNAAPGALGEWIIPTNLNQRLDATMLTAQGTLTNLDSNLLSLNRSLDNVGNITSNLNNQVQANTNILSNISSIVVHSDEFIQGLKKFWLFRHLFAAHTTNAPPAIKHEHPASPRQKGG